jgi:hypothetical protein
MCQRGVSYPNSCDSLLTACAGIQALFIEAQASISVPSTEK